MYCPKCGKQLPENAAFCSGCGAVLNHKQEQRIRKQSDKLDATVLIPLAINVLCIVMYILPWIQIAKFKIPGIYSTNSHSYNVIDLFRLDTSTAVEFYQYFYEKNIGFWMGTLKLVCGVGILVLIWHIISAGYLLLEKKDTPIPWIRYAISGIIAMIFVIGSLWLKVADFGLQIALDSELTGGAASSGAFDLTNYLSVTAFPVVLACIAGSGCAMYVVAKQGMKRFEMKRR